MNGQDATANKTSSPIKIPGYRIKGVLGRGGMATVYLAIQESLNRKVALKILDQNQVQGEQFSKRFLREARIVSQLMHPNIVTVFDVGVYQGYHYLSMEYIAGRDLKQAYMDLSRKELINIIKDIARALNFSAKKGYVHRDVKPENIMLHEGDNRVLLMDFGIARSYQNNHGLTKIGSALGTPYYMSPEQNKGLHADHRSDIYSLGVVFFYVLSGYVPYDADSAVAIGIKHITAEIPILSGELKIFQPIINTCMAKEADDRYQTAAELIQALDKISDADLLAIEERSASFQQEGKDHHAQTLIGAEFDSHIDHSIATKTAAPVSTPTSASKSHERKAFGGFLLILVLLISGSLIYQQRNELINYAKSFKISWLNQLIEKIQPLLVHQQIAKKIQIDEVKKTTTSAPVATPIKAPVATDEIKVQKTIDAQYALKLNYIDKIQALIDSNNSSQALKLMAQMQVTFPELSEEIKFITTHEQLQQVQTIARQLDSAKKYIESGTIFSADNNNAISELETILRLQADNQEALILLGNINRRWLTKSIQQSASWRLRKDLQALDSLLGRLNTEHAPLLTQQKELQQAISNLARIMNLLKLADENFNKGLYISPENNNAYQYYQKALSISPHNRHAKEQLRAIQFQLENQITQSINEDRLTQAALFIEQIQSIYKPSDWLLKIEASLEQAVDARQPKIDKVRLSSRPLKSLNQAQETNLQPGRRLHIGFHFKNMVNAPTLLQAALLDGSGRIKIAQKPVILSASEGNHFFQIDLPVEGFSEGSYILEVRLENKRLLSQTFLVGSITQP
ncbi:Serine/threonine protein kinase PpkA [hydrothermal vent metagenome]|uniref:Serine/threonine protein kinase PpkA n=1 Tax=hydrothermal vent metagenome TaxID=652676 RepID=A0A3B1BFF8_9ZZZZ